MSRGMTGVTFTNEIKLFTEECCSCGVVFAMPDSLQQQFRNNGGYFHCPNGHAQHYRESEVDRLKKSLAVKTAEASQERENFFAEQRRHEETQKKMQRLKKRTAAGVCPCCKRTFSQLSRHMHSKHSEFVKENGVPALTEQHV